MPLVATGNDSLTWEHFIVEGLAMGF
jgi:hypothetical protein